MEAERSNTDSNREPRHPDLRDWLSQLVAADRLVVARRGVSLIDELAAIARN